MTTTNRRRSRIPRALDQISQPAWKTLSYQHSAHELLSVDAIESIHQAGLKILQETGMAILSENARQHFNAAGFDVNHETSIVRFDPDLIESLVNLAPSSFTLRAHDGTLRKCILFTVDIQLGQS